MMGRPVLYCATCGEYIERRPDIILGRIRMGYHHVSETGALIYRAHKATPETQGPENGKENA